MVTQLVKSQQPADRLLRLIKRAIDQTIIQEKSLQALLGWLSQKSDSLSKEYKTSAVRSFYYALTFGFEKDLACVLDSRLSHVLSSYLFPDLDRNQGHNRDHDFDCDSALICALNCSLRLVSELEFDLDYYPDLKLTQAINNSLSSDLTRRLRHLQNQLPALDSLEEHENWWMIHGEHWTEKLRQVMVDGRNIGRYSQFDEDQKERFREYYNSNEFLISLVKVKGAVSETCRNEIEEGLLLPWSELCQRQPHIYGDLN